jgi:hypothetical protein
MRIFGSLLTSSQYVHKHYFQSGSNMQNSSSGVNINIIKKLYMSDSEDSRQGMTMVRVSPALA